jgi:hypothetical protein
VLNIGNIAINAFRLAPAGRNIFYKKTLYI